MGQRLEIPQSWEQANRLLAGGRSKYHRTVANNTSLVDLGGRIALRLYSTNVIEYLEDGSLELDMGGWASVTTRDRINKALPGPWRLWSVRSDPWIGYAGYGVLPYLDGLIIDPSGPAIRFGNEVIMSADDIAAEMARLDVEREKRQAARQVRLAAQHERGVAGEFGTVEVYDWRTRTSTTEVAYHPRTWNGTVTDCIACRTVQA